MYRSISEKLRDRFETISKCMVAPVYGWQKMMMETKDLVSIPHTLHLRGRKSELLKLLIATHRNYQCLSRDDARLLHDTVHDTAYLGIFNFSLSTFGNVTSIELLTPMRQELNYADNEVPRFRELTLYLALKYFKIWTKTTFETKKLYIESKISCFPDVAIDLGFRLRSMENYGQQGWRAANAVTAIIN